MADIRIKDLATLESASLTGDVFVIDGTTGTRKLSAFSPSFGGNATVTGTLTVSGKAASSGYVYAGGTLSAFESAAGLYSYYSGGGVIGAYSDSSGTRAAMTIDGTTLSLRPNGVTADRLLIDSNGITAKAVTVSGTTASTSTSSGALVVGNGTSGGLGVGGAINAGGNIVLYPASVAASGEVGNLRIADSSNTNRKLFFGLDNTVSPNGVGYIQSTLTGTTTIPLQLQPLGGSLSVGNSGTVVTLNGTTASTSTSTGALVVSGGVGVAGAIVAGSFIRSAGANNISLGADAGKNRIDAGGATDTPVRALGTADALTGIEMRLLGIIDGTSAPAATAGYAKLYVDSADGDLKVIFGDGTVKTIATDN